jgi:hypothetical protein
MWARSCGTLSDSVKFLGGVGGAVDVDISLETGKLEKEKLSSDQEMLSRRNAAVVRRFPVWSSTMASSIRPRWQQA